MPTWRVLARGVDPAVELRVIVSAVDGHVLSTRDLIRRVDGVGRVFDPSPVVKLGDTTLMDQNDSAGAVPGGAYSTVVLRSLDAPVAGMYSLRGTCVSVEDMRGPSDTPASEADPARFTYLRDDDRFEQVMAYRSVDELQRWLQGLGFTDVLNRQLRVDAHALNADNSYFAPGDFTLNFGNGGVDDAEDADIIHHESGHAIQEDIVPGFGPGAESGAQGEGFGDYLAATRHASFGFNNECVGAWDATSYSVSTPPCLRRVDSTKHYPEDIVGEVHADGEIWSTALWQIRQRTGGRATDMVVIQSHFLLPANPSFRMTALAMLQADADLGLGAKRDICDVMIARGILQPTDCPSDLAIDSVSVDDAGAGGDGDGWLEPGESANLVVSLRNQLDATHRTVSVTLTPRAPTPVTMVRATASYPDMGPLATESSLAPRHRVSVAPGATCGSDVTFDAVITSDLFVGSGSFSLTLGEPVTTGPHDGSFTGPPIDIPDNDPIGIFSNIALATASRVASIADVSIEIPHTFIGDLQVSLISPSGTVVRLHDRTGGDADNLIRSYPVPTAIDGPGTLADFVDEPITGNWTLFVADVGPADIGQLVSWSISIIGTGFSCSAIPCTGEEIATGGDGLLMVTKGAGGAVRLTYPSAASACATGVQVRRAPTAWPASLPGSFPSDPLFTDVTSQDADPGATFEHVPPGGNSYYLVVESLPGGAPGPSGSYGP